MEIRQSYDRLISTMGFLYRQDVIFILNRGPDHIMQTALLWFALLWFHFQFLRDSYDFYKPTFFRVASQTLALQQAFGCPGASEVSSKDMGTNDQYQTKTNMIGDAGN